jgi:hypothetical protein
MRFGVLSVFAQFIMVQTPLSYRLLGGEDRRLTAAT